MTKHPCFNYNSLCYWSYVQWGDQYKGKCNKTGNERTKWHWGAFL